MTDLVVFPGAIPALFTPPVPLPAPVGEWDARSYTTNFDPLLADPWVDETGNGYTLTRSDEVNMRVKENFFGVGAHAVRHWGGMERINSDIGAEVENAFTISMLVRLPNQFFTSAVFGVNDSADASQRIYLSANTFSKWAFYWKQGGTEEIHDTGIASPNIADVKTVVCTMNPTSRRMTVAIDNGTQVDHTFTAGVGATWTPDRFATGGVEPHIGWCKMFSGEAAADDVALRTAMHAEMASYIP